ncbi:recombinase family protein [Nocardia araoensis]|uniref:recombinase family protein n=1 Tax=Nocardia araoensis TaxID=228600 RepID=UPI000A076073|nr:recombinase family protein [Nocardia araoensis]
MDQHPEGGWDLGYARVSSAEQSLDRQLAALADAGIPHPRIYVDEKTGATVDRPGPIRLVAYARPGDRIVVHILDRMEPVVAQAVRIPDYEVDPATVPMERRPAACMSRVLAASMAIGIIRQPRLCDAPVAGLAAGSLGSAQRRCPVSQRSPIGAVGRG